MSTIQKRIDKLNRTPIPSDITIDDVKALAFYYGCFVRTGGNHQIQVIHVDTGTVIPIPCHGKHVPEYIVKELKQLFHSLKGED